jgi:hypothetical protein
MSSRPVAITLRLMRSVLISLFQTATVSLRSRAALQLESLALRHQLQVLQRSRPRRLRLTQADRPFWVSPSRVWTQWRSFVDGFRARISRPTGAELPPCHVEAPQTPTPGSSNGGVQQQRPFISRTLGHSGGLSVPTTPYTESGRAAFGLTTTTLRSIAESPALRTSRTRPTHASIVVQSPSRTRVVLSPN